jgi:hypothetical protein
MVWIKILTITVTWLKFSWMSEKSMFWSHYSRMKPQVPAFGKLVEIFQHHWKVGPPSEIWVNFIDQWHSNKWFGNKFRGIAKFWIFIDIKIQIYQWCESSVSVICTPVSRFCCHLITTKPQWKMNYFLISSPNNHFSISRKLGVNVCEITPQHNGCITEEWVLWLKSKTLWRGKLTVQMLQIYFFSNFFKRIFGIFLSN